MSLLFIPPTLPAADQDFAKAINKKWAPLAERRDELESLEQEFDECLRGKDEDGNDLPPPNAKQIAESYPRRLELLKIYEVLEPLVLSAKDWPARCFGNTPLLDTENEFKSKLQKAQADLFEPTIDALKTAAKIKVDPADRTAAAAVYYLILTGSMALDELEASRKKLQGVHNEWAAMCDGLQSTLREIRAKRAALTEKLAGSKRDPQAA